MGLLDPHPRTGFVFELGDEFWIDFVIQFARRVIGNIE